MRSEIDALMIKAQRSLKNARVSCDLGDFDFAVSRAYYAMFYLATALLLSRGQSFSKHSAVIAAFNREFIVTRQLPEHHAAALRNAFEQRLIGDYEYLESFPERQARSILEGAEAFVTEVEALLRQTGGE